MSQSEVKESVREDSASKVDHYLDKLITKLGSPPPIKHQSDHIDYSGDDVFIDCQVNTEKAERIVENQPFESNIDEVEDLEALHQEESEEDVETVAQHVPETHSPHVASCSNSLATTALEKRPMSSKVSRAFEAKHQHTLSPTDLPLKSFHSRENSASSLLEETLESAKTIASIYSVQGPTRSPSGEDSLTTASEMRRHSLAKRVVKRRPKLDSSTFSPDRDEPVTTSDSSLNESTLRNAGNNDEENRSVSLPGSRPDCGLLSPKMVALEEQKVSFLQKMYALFYVVFKECRLMCTPICCLQ